VKIRSEISFGDFAKSRRPAQSTETHGSSPTTHTSRPGGISKVLRPVSAWLEYGASDGQVSQLDQLDPGLLDRADRAGTVETLAAQLHGTDRTNRGNVGGQQR
jgi:hypothetical protein